MGNETNHQGLKHKITDHNTAQPWRTVLYDGDGAWTQLVGLLSYTKWLIHLMTSDGRKVRSSCKDNFPDFLYNHLGTRNSSILDPDLMTGYVALCSWLQTLFLLLMRVWTTSSDQLLKGGSWERTNSDDGTRNSETSACKALWTLIEVLHKPSPFRIVS